MNLSYVSADRFWKDGYLLVKCVYPREEILALRQRGEEIFEKAKEAGELLTERSPTVALKGDLLSLPYFQDLVWDKRLLSVAEILLEGPPVYYGDSTVHLRGPTPLANGHSWHKDNRGSDRYDPKGQDWVGKYDLIRFGIYFQDHAKHSGGLAIRRGSHEMASVTRGKTILVPTEPGDVVIWNLRSTHAGNAVRLKFGLPALNHPWLRFVPDWLRCPEQTADRMAAFVTFAKKGAHLDRYIAYLKTAKGGLDHLKDCHFGASVWDRARSHGLEVLRIIPEYGTEKRAA